MIYIFYAVLATTVAVWICEIRYGRMVATLKGIIQSRADKVIELEAAHRVDTALLEATKASLEAATRNVAYWQETAGDLAKSLSKSTKRPPAKKAA